MASKKGKKNSNKNNNNKKNSQNKNVNNNNKNQNKNTENKNGKSNNTENKNIKKDNVQSNNTVKENTNKKNNQTTKKEIQNKNNINKSKEEPQEKNLEEQTFELEKKIEELQVLEEKSDAKIKKPKNENNKNDIKKEIKPETRKTKDSNEDKKTEKSSETVKEDIKRNENIIYLTVNIILIVLVISIFSTMFAIFNLGKHTFVKGIKIKNIDVSNLTVEEARNKIEEALNIELMIDIDLKYNDDYEVSFQSSQIEYKYNIDKILSDSYMVGRSGNIIENNYKLLFTAFIGKNFEPEYSYNEEALDYIVNDISSKLPNLVIQPTHYIEGEQLIINKGTDGINVEKEKLKEQILSAIKNRSAEQIVVDSSNQIIEIPVIQTKSDNIDIEKVYSEVYTEPKDAYYVENPFEIFVEKDGIDFGITIEEAKNIIASEDKDEYIIPIKITKPLKTINDIGAEAFPYVISEFSTRYNARDYNRTGNLELAANKINGTVLMPGDIFSFNKIVGKRTVEDGYRNAKIYQNGQVVDGLAGGICQVSSTLYNVVLLANLQIYERTNHSFKTSYLPTGKDATVVYGVKDFQFINSRTYPIKIEAIVDSGIIEFKIHGIKEEVEYEVRITPVTTQYLPYTTQYIPDTTLPPGAQVVAQNGTSGSKVTTYKELILNGAVVSKELLSNDTYSPMHTIIKVGP